MAGDIEPRTPGEGTAPPVETPQPPPPPVETPTDQPNVPRETEQEPRQDWRDRRIGEQQQRLRERNARIAQLEAELAARGGSEAPQPGQPPQYGQQPAYQPVGTPPQGDIQRQINEAAARLAANNVFTDRCNEVAQQGRRVYTNFDQRVQRLVGLVDGQDPVQVGHYNDFLKAAMQTGQAPRLIYELGGDLDEASRIMAMDAIGMTHELTRLSMRPGTESSGAPPPITPLASAAQSNRTMVQPDDPETADTLDTTEWMRRRNEQMQTRRQRTLG